MPTASPTSCCTARTDRQTKLSGLIASRASSVFNLGSVAGKTAIAGIPNSAASVAARLSESSPKRLTPGRLWIGCSPLGWSTTKSGQIKSSTVSLVSDTKRRDQSCRRNRRIRTAGKEPRAEENMRALPAVENVMKRVSRAFAPWKATLLYFVFCSCTHPHRRKLF